MHPLSTLLLLLLLLLPGATGLGRPRGPAPNCHGSAYCSTFESWWFAPATFLETALEAVKPGGLLATYGNNTNYHKGRHIMCRGHDILLGTICMFMEQNVPKEGVPMGTIIERLAVLNSTGCLSCGSVPLSAEEPTKHGRLVVNYVVISHCDLEHFCIGIDEKKVARGGVEQPTDGPGSWGLSPTAAATGRRL